MSTYAIGDLQGCYASLQALLTKVEFDRRRDRLWLVGDLVNRGPASLQCLRFVHDLGDGARVVLGNHDLNLLAVAEGVRKCGRRDTIQEILDAPDGAELLAWLRRQHLVYAEGGYVMVHAGLLPQWSLTLALALAGEIETLLRGPGRGAFLKSMYGDEPNHWSDTLPDSARQRLVTNVMTRMRVIGKKGEIDLAFKGTLATIPPGKVPWFSLRHPSLADKTILAGHWSALGLYVTPKFVGLDSGCAWGKELTAFRLEDHAIFQVRAVERGISLQGE
ncbi:MAG: symmetrical bis(5'-nucleosyl)-tetraphosphatase [Usitatibacteraceae bacterium]